MLINTWLEVLHCNASMYPYAKQQKRKERLVFFTENNPKPADVASQLKCIYLTTHRIHVTGTKLNNSFGFI